MSVSEPVARAGSVLGGPSKSSGPLPFNFSFPESKSSFAFSMLKLPSGSTEYFTSQILKKVSACSRASSLFIRMLRLLVLRFSVAKTTLMIASLTATFKLVIPSVGFFLR